MGSCGSTRLSASRMSQAQQEAILRGKQETFGEFIWNSERGEFLGRTGTSWTKIGVFYVLLYAFLAGFFSCMMAVFYTTLDTNHLPKYSPGNKDPILRNPALGFRPLPRKENVESTLIWYNTGNTDDIQHWVDSLNEFIKPYEGKGEEKQTSDVKDCSEENPAIVENGEVCKFDFQSLGTHCTEAESWGYSRKSPCVILKMNKMIGWIPEVYTKKDIDEEKLPKDMPEDLVALIKQSATDNGGEPSKMVWVSCKGENPADQEYIGKIEYTPWQGFPAYFFPYMNTPGYLPPIVAVRFVEPASNVLINVECKAWAKNIDHNRKERLGLVHFELLRD